MYAKVYPSSAYISIFAFKKLVSIPKLHLMIEILKYLNTAVLKKNTHLTVTRGVSVYHENSLTFKVINVKYLQECISFEIRVGEKCCRFVSLRSPSHKNDQFNIFLKNFELTLDKVHENNPFMTCLSDEFGAKCNY